MRNKVHLPKSPLRTASYRGTSRHCRRVHGLYPSPLAPERRAQSTRNQRISRRVHYGPSRAEARRGTLEEGLAVSLNAPSPPSTEHRVRATKRTSQRVHCGPPRTEARRDTSEEHTGRASQRVDPSTEQRKSPESASPKESATDRLAWKHVEKLQMSEPLAALTACT